MGSKKSIRPKKKVKRKKKPVRRRTKSLEEIATGYRTETLGTGEALYHRGQLQYLDDGNGNVFDRDEWNENGDPEDY